MPIQTINDDRRFYFEDTRIINRKELLSAIKEKASRSSLALKIKQGKFPPPTVKKGRHKCWLLKDIDHLINIHKLQPSQIRS